MRKVKSIEADKHYKEHNEPHDYQELENRAELAVTPPEGSDPVPEEAKFLALKKARFQILTKSFFDPDGAVAHQRKLDREAMRNSSSQDRSGTPNTTKDGANDTTVVEEKYYPLIPEQWKEAFLELKELRVLKMTRVLQTLFYLLGYKREDICERDTNKLELKKIKSYLSDDLL